MCRIHPSITSPCFILQADPALLRLPAPGLRGTWARAYALLTRLVSQIGWDELLKTSSSVFVMEEEYRMQKALNESHASVGQSGDSTTAVGESSTLATSNTEAELDDNASTKAVRVRSTTGTPMHSPKPTTGSGTEVVGIEAVTNGIPTIRISTESTREPAKSSADEEPTPTNGNENGNGDAKADPGVGEAAGHSLAHPRQAAAGESDKESNGDAASGPPQQEPFSFSNKRLCERWLDNLFMVLYEVKPAYLLFHGIVLTSVAGPPCMDNLPRRSCALQDPARCVPQDRHGVGDPG